MKNSFLFTLMVCITGSLILSSTGCKKDDNPTLNSILQGNWEVTNWVSGSDVLDLTEYNSLTFNFASTGDNTGVFTLIGDGVDNNDDFTIPGTYQIGNDDKMFSFLPTGDLDNIIGEITITNNTFVFTGNYEDKMTGDVLEASIIQATKK